MKATQARHTVAEVSLYARQCAMCSTKTHVPYAEPDILKRKDLCLCSRTCYEDWVTATRYLPHNQERRT